MARIGKIARLPLPVRDELNQRLDHGEPAASILAWLNGRDDVRLLLQEGFRGQPINEPNLTAWRQGGYRDWKQEQQTCDWVRALSEQAAEVAQESGSVPLSDRVSSLAVVSLARLLQTIGSEAVINTSKTGQFVQLLRQLAHMRREDHEGARLHLELERCASEGG